MTYEEKKKLIESAKELKEYCRYIGPDKCEGCLFLVSGFCELENVPNVWEIPKLTRWTPEDVALAKALKGIGVEWVTRDFAGDIALFKNGIQLGEIIKVTNAFADLKEDEREFIDTIIKEAEG